jgi:hypothetical protein
MLKRLVVIEASDLVAQAKRELKQEWRRGQQAALGRSPRPIAGVPPKHV